LNFYFQLKPSDSEIEVLGKKHVETARDEAKKLTAVILSVWLFATIHYVHYI